MIITVMKRPSLCLQGWFSFNVAPNPNSPSTLLEWHVRATLHKHRRRPWWEAALSVASTVGVGDQKNVQTHRGSTANLSKNMQKYLKISQKNSCPISYKNERVRSTSDLHLGCFPIFPMCKYLTLRRYVSKVSFSCEASNLRDWGS